MTSLSGLDVLVFDTPSFRTERLKASLIGEGASVRVTGSILAAMDLLKTVKMDVAFVAYRADPMTRNLCRVLQALGVSVIFTGSCPTADSHRIAA